MQLADLAPTLTKGEDTMDVWFDSGSSWAGVVQAREPEGLTFPADLYLEGSDQHRGECVCVYCVCVCAHCVCVCVFVRMLWWPAGVIVVRQLRRQEALWYVNTTSQHSELMQGRTSSNSCCCVHTGTVLGTAWLCHS